MPKIAGRRAVRVAKAHERERAATEALTAGLHLHKPTSKAMRDLHTELTEARADKDAAHKHPEDEFDCSFCGKKFRSVHRLILEVPLATEHDLVRKTYTSESTGEIVEVEEAGEVRELRDRMKPHYLIACPTCIPKVWKHLTE